MRKKTSRSEYLIHKKLYKILPKYIPKPISYKNGILTSQKRGLSLKKWLKTHKYTNGNLMRIINNVVLILKRIHARYPTFKHMDLHLDNILLHNGRILLIDFDMSKFTSMVNKCYDVHFFMNSLRHFLLKLKTKKYKKTILYLNKRLPSGFRGHTDKYVKNFRLRPEGVSSASAASIAMKLLQLKKR